MRRIGILTAGICLAVLLSGRSASAASLTLAWDPETGADVSGYVVAYGTQSGVYTKTIQAGNQTSQQVDGLADGTTYYFVVHAYSSLGVMSPPSAEVWGQTPGVSSIPPYIECPSPTAVSPDGKPVAVNFAPSGSGGAAPLKATCSPAPGSLFPVGSTPATCTVIDALQMTASCNTSVVVTYNAPPTSAPTPSAPPTIMCPVPSATAANGKQVKVTFTPTVTGGTAPVNTVCSPASGGFFSVGSTAVVCTAVDAKQVTASCQTVVTVADSGTSPTPTPEPPSTTTTSLTFDGTILQLSGGCPVLSFTAGGHAVLTNSSTDYARGSCSSMAAGKAVHVVGVLDSTSRVVATSITFTK